MSEVMDDYTTHQKCPKCGEHWQIDIEEGEVASPDSYLLDDLEHGLPIHLVIFCRCGAFILEGETEFEICQADGRYVPTEINPFVKK